MAWFSDWFGTDYLELYAHRDAAEAERHVAFLATLWGTRPPTRVLDLACGAGRHTAALTARGIPTVGVDLSLTLLGEGPGLPRVRADMRRLPLADGTVEFVLNAFTSFGYFASERENFSVLEEIVRVLAPGGGFLIDFLNRDRALANLVGIEERHEPGRRVAIRRWFDAASERVNKEIIITPDGSDEPRHFCESVRAYRREEITIGAQWAGLVVTATYGDFAGTPFDQGSERLVLVGRKP